MSRAWFPKLVGVCVLAVTAGGCKWVGGKSDFQRDPFVMSHLTHNKNDPLFASSEGDEDWDSPTRSASATARKAEVARTSAPATPAQRSPYQQVSARAPRGRAEDFKWIEGRLEHRNGNKPGWHIRYATNAENDTFGGEIRLANNPRLGLMREGDLVYVTGRLMDGDNAERRYEVETISLLD